MIVSFLKGKAKKDLSPSNCRSIGFEVAKMHKLTKDLKVRRENDLSVKSWRGLFDSVKGKCSKIHKEKIWNSICFDYGAGSDYQTCSTKR